MKVIYLLLVFCSISFGQFGSLVLTGDSYNFEGGTVGSWTSAGLSDLGVTTLYPNTLDPTSTYIMYGVSINTSDRGAITNAAIQNGVLYRFWTDWNAVQNSDVDANQRLSYADAVSNSHDLTETPLTPGWKQYSFDATTGTATLDLAFYATVGASFLGDTLAWDNVEIRTIRDTLWTFKTGVDTDEDTTLTLGDAFNARGVHLGGYFITGPGTYSESIIFLPADSTFTKWEATGKAEVTSVDFNGVTATVDLANLVIIRKLNDSNITYLNRAEKLTFPSFPRWPN